MSSSMSNGGEDGSPLCVSRRTFFGGGERDGRGLFVGEDESLGFCWVLKEVSLKRNFRIFGHLVRNSCTIGQWEYEWPDVSHAQHVRGTEVLLM